MTGAGERHRKSFDVFMRHTAARLRGSGVRLIGIVMSGAFAFTSLGAQLGDLHNEENRDGVRHPIIDKHTAINRAMESMTPMKVGSRMMN